MRVLCMAFSGNSTYHIIVASISLKLLEFELQHCTNTFLCCTVDIVLHEYLSLFIWSFQTSDSWVPWTHSYQGDHKNCSIDICVNGCKGFSMHKRTVAKLQLFGTSYFSIYTDTVYCICICGTLHMHTHVHCCNSVDIFGALISFGC